MKRSKSKLRLAFASVVAPPVAPVLFILTFMLSAAVKHTKPFGGDWTVYIVSLVSG
jgi:hypothetical protein